MELVDGIPFSHFVRPWLAEADAGPPTTVASTVSNTGDADEDADHTKPTGVWRRHANGTKARKGRKRWTPNASKPRSTNSRTGFSRYIVSKSCTATSSPPT